MMEVNQRVVLLGEHQDKQSPLPIPKRRLLPKARTLSWTVRYPLLFRISLSVSGLASLVLLGFVIHYFWSLQSGSPLNAELLEVKKCPACAGQSACPAFLRGEILVTKRQISQLDGYNTPLGIDGSMGLYELIQPVNLRRLATPASPQAVDAAVCRRGLQHGFHEAANSDRSRLRCIPHLAIYRWRPTNDPVDGSSEDPVDQPLYRDLVTAPKFEKSTIVNQTKDEVAEEQEWSNRVMSTAFAPATRCASHRLFAHLQSRFRERTTFGAPTRWLRFDELMFLYNLAVDPQSVLWQAFPREESWPFPTHIGACGRWTLQDYHGVPLDRFCGSPLWLRLRILSNILEIPSRLDHSSPSSEMGSSSQSASDGFVVYLGNFALSSLFTVNPRTLKVTVANLRHAIVVDTLELTSSTTASNLTEHTVPEFARTLVLHGMAENRCEGDSAASGDAGGTTPPCLDRAHADALCRHARSDHNFWSVCVALIHGSTQASDPCANFLSDAPSDVVSRLEQCVTAISATERRRLFAEARELLLNKLQSYPEPVGL